jgi:hypothetical protein
MSRLSRKQTVTLTESQWDTVMSGLLTAMGNTHNDVWASTINIARMELGKELGHKTESAWEWRRGVRSVK